ncbi:MAG: 3-deoxy-D-manno-octulosonic acid transferase, partial [Flavobacteriaceae bacterium]|nr:3-deoxy-D-manno-octulosonic acid transferase [Flavobacteriaceae bacterium]
MLFTESEKKKPSEYQVLIINTIGLLSKIYKYADIVYVGGGFGVGIHNILEPATFSVPVLIGPNFKKFKEANDLVGLGA